MQTSLHNCDVYIPCLLLYGWRGRSMHVLAEYSYVAFYQSLLTQTINILWLHVWLLPGIPMYILSCLCKHF